MVDLSEIFAKLEVPLEAKPASDFKTDGCFGNAADAVRFILAGNATITLRSKKTGARFTYRVRASEDGRVHFVSLLNGQDNESNYAYFGYLRRGLFIHGGQKAKVGADAPSAKAFAWAWQQLASTKLPDMLEVWHEGRCGRCGRKLTVPASIASGFGPECEGRVV